MHVVIKLINEFQHGIHLLGKMALYLKLIRTMTDTNILCFIYRKCCKKQEDKSEITRQCLRTKYNKWKSHRLHIFGPEQRRGDEATGRFTRDL